MRPFFLALLPALLLVSCKKVEAPDPLNLPEVAVPSFTDANMKEMTKTLSSDEYEGRAPGSAGGTKTSAYLAQKFKAAGLEGGGENGGWFQKVPLLEITPKNISPLVFTQENGTKLLYKKRRDFVVTSNREQRSISVTDSDVVFVGYGINAPEKGWNDYKGVDVKGKTVLILVNDPDFGAETLEGDFGGKAMTYYGRWTYKYEEAARQGATAAFIIHDTAPAAYGWNVVETGWSGTQFLAQTGNKGADQSLANGWVQKNVAHALFNAAGLDMESQMQAAKSNDFKPISLGLKASVSFENNLAVKNSNNVIGLLKGTKRADEYIIYTAHWDHLGRCTAAADGDDICNGAIDNATGTAALVTLAQMFQKAGPPERSILFLAVTAEESGLLGSQYYAENPLHPLSQIVGGVNMDAFSMAGAAKNLIVIGKGKSQLDDYLNVAAKKEGRIVDAEPTPEKGYYYRSDHFSFAKLGVPMIYFEGGDDLVNGGKEAGALAAKDYEENRYHQAKDEYDENWDWSGVMADLRIYYRVGRMLAMTDAWPNWREGDEFKAVRDQSRKGE